MYSGRYGNATTFKLDDMLAHLEQADGVTLTSSGVAVIPMTLLNFARPGAHLLVEDHVYGNTRAFVDALHHFGVGVSWGGYKSLVMPVTPQPSAGTLSEDGQLVPFNIRLDDLRALKASLTAALPHLNTASE